MIGIGLPITDRLVIPPGAACFVNSLQAGNSTSCPITNDMLMFLDITQDFKHYFKAYCLSPPWDDGCPYGYCPNSDIAGILVRVSAYLTNFFVAILVFYQPEELNESFWSQLLNLYSLLLTCGWTIIRNHLSRIHAVLATATAGSPLTLCLFVYAVRSIWDGNHRLASAVGRGRIFPRLIVLTALLIWAGLLIYIILPSHLSNFTQRSCEQTYQPIIRFFFFLPILLFVDIPRWAQYLVAVPIPLTVLTWIFVILLKRREIWPRGEPFRFRFRTVWRVVKGQYPFIQFISIIAIPFAYWVATIETVVIASKTKDDHLDTSFGQVLALFVALPPVISTAKLIPRLLNWYLELAWVRLLTCRLRRREKYPHTRPLMLTSSYSSVDSGFGYEKKQVLGMTLMTDSGHSFLHEC